MAKLGRRMLVRSTLGALKTYARPASGRFNKAADHPRRAQQTLVRQLVKRVSQTEYGRQHQIDGSEDLDLFRQRLPIVTYETLAPWIEKQKAQGGKVLVDEPVVHFEKTSGSSGPAKYIPYTASLKRSFEQMFLTWAYDVLAHGPTLRTGSIYFSVSPALCEETQTKQGIPIGMEDDADYLSPRLQSLLRPFFVADPRHKRLRRAADFKRALALTLISASDLEIISVWSPSFLTVCLDYIRDNTAALLADLQAGRVCLDGIDFEYPRLSSARETALRRGDWPALWPFLSLISCWSSSQAQSGAARLQAAFPNVLVQGKGLLATEAPMTIPFIGSEGFAPMVGDIFFEFEDAAGNLFLIDELCCGQEYELIISQPGGLSRYRLGDRIVVNGQYRNTPTFDFVGREASVCDLVGEKLNEQFVATCLQSQDLIGVLLPAKQGDLAPHYTLLTNTTAKAATSLAHAFDEALMASFHFRNARLLGQLAPTQVQHAANPEALLLDHFVAKGICLGDIKPRALLSDLEDAQAILAQVKFGAAGADCKGAKPAGA